MKIGQYFITSADPERFQEFAEILGQHVYKVEYEDDDGTVKRDENVYLCQIIKDTAKKDIGDRVEKCSATERCDGYMYKRVSNGDIFGTPIVEKKYYDCNGRLRCYMRKAGKKKEARYYDADGKLHRVNGPADYSNMRKCSKYYWHGIRHRVGGPALHVDEKAYHFMFGFMFNHQSVVDEKYNGFWFCHPKTDRNISVSESEFNSLCNMSFEQGQEYLEKRYKLEMLEGQDCECD